MSYLDWKVGDKVVCVDSDWTFEFVVNGKKLHLPNRQPMDGEVLTIIDIEAGQGEWGTGRADGVYVAFEEIPLIQSDGSRSLQIRWDASHFRKVQPRKTDISVFTALLHSSPSKVTA